MSPINREQGRGAFLDSSFAHANELVQETGIVVFELPRSTTLVPLWRSVRGFGFGSAREFLFIERTHVHNGGEEFEWMDKGLVVE